MGKLRQKSSGAEHAETAAIINRSIALELSASVANESRLAFAESFSAEVVAAYWEIQRRGRPALRPLVRPLGFHDVTLTPNALSAAHALAAGIPAEPLAEAAYAIGTLYTALLPEAFRAQHGIFYTPPELVECLLLMTEESGIDWRTARVLDPACGRAQGCRAGHSPPEHRRTAARV
jgi:adenine-specific DNA-methyltransferase